MPPTSSQIRQLIRQARRDVSRYDIHAKKLARNTVIQLPRVIRKFTAETEDTFDVGLKAATKMHMVWVHRQLLVDIRRAHAKLVKQRVLTLERQVDALLAKQKYDGARD